MTEREGDPGAGAAAPAEPANVAPDAVRDPNERTEGKPGLGPPGGQADEADPGGS